jgi:hypothetical protein
MRKYRCTLSSGSYLYYVTVVAASEQQAKEMAAVEADKKWRGYGLGRAGLERGTSGIERVRPCADFRM